MVRILPFGQKKVMNYTYYHLGPTQILKEIA